MESDGWGATRELRKAEAGNTGAWRAYLTVVLLNLTALGVITWHLRDPTAGAVRIVLPSTLPPPPTQVAPAAPTHVRLVVHVAGAVVRSGVVSLAEGARVADAVSAAGGLASNADQERLNLAAAVADGSMLWVPAVDEEFGPAVPPLGPALAAPGMWQGSSADVPPGGSAAQEGVNVNTATAAELETLPGIGPSLAARIIAFREAQGPFAAADGMLDVPGIGPKTLERFVELVRVR